MRRRVWWCIYGLDKALSIALGRPSGAHDDDCNVEMRESLYSSVVALTDIFVAAELDDSQMLVFFAGEHVSPSMSYMTAFVP
jgi:hypothetical protein